MKKWSLILMVTFVSSFLLLSDNAFAGYLVSDAGREGVDGLYCETNDDSCGPEISYEKAGSIWTIYFANGKWAIGYRVFSGPNGECEALATTYLNDEATSSPPLNNWQALSVNDNPAPSLLMVPCELESKAEAVPTTTEWGLIVLSLLLIASATWFIRKRKRTS